MTRYDPKTRKRAGRRFAFAKRMPANIDGGAEKGKENNIVRPGDRKRSRRRSGGQPHGRWLYGRHTVLAALNNPDRHVFRLLVSDPEAGLPADIDISPEIASRETLSALLPPGAVHQGYAALADPLPDQAVEQICDRAAGRERSLVVVLDQVTDPHNVGAVLRSAAVFGALAVVMQERNAPEPSGVLAKSASGALESVPLVRAVNLARALETLKAAGFWCLGLDSEATTRIDDIPAVARRALVLGAEGAGLRRLTREACDELARIDGSGPMKSLNVSNAAAVALYALSRRAVP
jgi:23S rRNA (guanosine2251-2'-O)-methyltransferase